MMLGATVMLKAQNPYPIIALDSVQFVNDTKLSLPIVNDTMDYISPVFKNPLYRDTVRFEGIVVTNPKIYGLSINRKASYVQRKGGGPWSGVLVMCDFAGITPSVTLPNLIAETKFYDNFVVGYKVRVTGVARTFNGTGASALKQGETQINLIRNNLNWDNFVEQVDLVKDTLVYSEIEARDLQTGNPNTNWQQQRLTGEKWEGVLVRIKNVTVYSVQISGNRTFWSVIDDFGNVLDVRDFSSYYRRDGNGDSASLNVVDVNRFTAPSVGTRLEYIQGIAVEYQVGQISRYGISPIYPSDYKVCTSCPPIIKYVNRNPIVAKVTDSLNLTFEVTVGDTTLKTQYLYYKSPATPNQLDSVLMTAVPSFPNYYVGKVPPVGTEGVLTYWVRAEDKRGRQTFFPDPLTLGNTFYVTTNGVNSIQQLQFSNTTSGSSIWAGDSLLNIDVRGVVTGINFGNMLTVQNGTGPNSAIFIQKGSNGTVNSWQVGDSVQITRATVGETFNTTNLYNILGSVISSGNVLPPMATNLSMDSFALTRVAYARPYEGVLVRFDSVEVFSVNPDGPASDFGEFSINAKNTTPSVGLRVDDLSQNFKALNKKIKQGMMIGFIQGPMYFANGNFKLIPRNMADIDLTNLDSIAPVITILGLNPDTVDLGTSYTDMGATAIDNLDGDISANIVTTGSVNTNAVGTYQLKYKATDAWGNMDSAMRTVVVVDTVSVGVNENEMNFAQLAVFPNPASNYITVSGNFVKTQPVTITVVDILGKVVSTRTVRGTKFNETLSTENLNNGVYFCTISNASGSKTLKFMVNGR